MGDLEREIETLTALREATRQAREAAKDLRAEVKAAREFRQEFLATPEMDARLGELTEAALAEYSASIDKNIKLATDAVWNRFDTITMICMVTGTGDIGSKEAEGGRRDDGPRVRYRRWR